MSASTPARATTATTTTVTPTRHAAATPSSTPRLLRISRGVAAAAALLTGVTATGTFSADGVNATANVVAQQWTAAERAGVEIAHAGLLGAERVAADDPEEAREAYDTLVSEVSRDLGSMGDSSGEAATAWSTFVTGAERAAAAARAGEGSAAEDYAGAADSARAATDRADAVADQHADDLRTGSRSTLTSVVGTLSTLVLLALLALLALRTRRILNVPLLVATLITAGLTYVSVNPGALPLSYDQRVAQTQETAGALQQVYEARAAQQLAALGVGADVEAQIEQAGDAVAAQDRQEWVDAWAAVASAPTDEAGLAQSQDAFDQLTEAQTSDLDGQFAAVSQEIGSPALVTSGVALLLGLVAAALAWAGVTQRLRDYR